MKATKMVFVVCLLVLLGSCAYMPVDEHDRDAYPVRSEAEERPVIRIVDLEASPQTFAAGKPIDFLVRVHNGGERSRGVDIGVFHEERLVGWSMKADIPRGTSTFRLRDDRFLGDAGSYIVKVRYRENLVDQKRFSTRQAGDGKFVLDPGDIRQDKGRQKERKSEPPLPWNDSYLTIANLEASPAIFFPRQPIDFVVTLRSRGPAASGFTIGVFHEGRQVGWQTNRVVEEGSSTFRLRDNGFTGDTGSYIVKVQRNGRLVGERKFSTFRAGLGYTLDPSKAGDGNRR